MPSDPIDLTVDPKGLLPHIVVNEWLPNEDQSILFLFQEFNRYPPYPSHYRVPTNLQPFLHQNSIQGFDYKSLLEIPPPALPSVPEAYQNAIRKSKHPILSITLQPQYGNPIVLPHWIFDYWVEIRRVVSIRNQWKIALTWVQERSTSPPAMQLSQSLLLGLSSFPWSSRAAYTRDFTSLLSSSSRESYLNSFHIDHMIGQTRAQYKVQHGPENTNRHIFATVDTLGAIIRFYSAVHVKKEGHLWENLMVIENKIIMGEVDSVGGVIHLPLHSHWVSVVIDFQQLQILYGDSLNAPMLQRERRACERWIDHLIKRSTKLSGKRNITLGQLPTGYQNDSNSCGLFALNAIAHHYLGDPLLPSDPTTLACRRMEITLNIVNTMTVCIFHMMKGDMTYGVL